MPATEKTWRDQKLLNVLFGASSVLLLVATMWMLARDHNRPWKKHQLAMRSIETRMSDMREQQEFSATAVAERERIERQLAEAIAAPISGPLLEQFGQQLESEESSGPLESLKKLAERHQQAGELAAEARAAFDAARAQAADAADKALAAEQAATEAEAAGDGAQERIQASEARDAAREADREADRLRGALDKADQAAAAARGRLIGELEGLIKSAKEDETQALSVRKDASALLDELKANYGLAVRDGADDMFESWREQIEAQKTEVDSLDAVYRRQQKHRKSLAAIVSQIQGEVTAKQKDLDAALATLKQLETARTDRRSNLFEGLLPGKKWLELPILDAFNSPVRPDNLWSDGLTQTYGSFGEVRRFDRCTTCHQGIDKTAPGSAVDPGYPHEIRIDYILATTTDSVGSGEISAQLMDSYGVRFAETGLLEDDALTVSVVAPESLAATARPYLAEDEYSGEQIREMVMTDAIHRGGARAGLRIGDVIAAIDGDPVRDPQSAQVRLADAVNSGKTLRLTIRRGLEHPYATHPRLDLFVGSLSPHTKAKFACTVCHDGQGSATDFKWASHTPDSSADRKRWSEEYGWFDNHHWIYPMQSKRFVESGCLKCHHDVTELRPSERFTQAPAPKVTRGYDLFTKYGCYGCHEVNGYDGPDKRVGPDRRLEPNYFAAALALKTDPGFQQLEAEQQGWFDELIQDPARHDLRKSILTMLANDAAADEPKFQPQSASKFGGLLKDQDAAGQLRKVGPSLRAVASKNDDAFLFDWITAPKRFRPSSRMPQFFQLWRHLDAEPKSLHLAQELEPVEVFATTFYLNQRSQEFEYLSPPEGVSPTTDEASIARGKVLFEERGCLACHEHGDFPEAPKYRAADDLIQGPDLSHVGSKFDPVRNPTGAKWLYSWIKEPTRYNPRTLMPHLYLDPITTTDAEGNTTTTDPVADIVAYLMTCRSDWSPEEYELNVAGLDRMTLEHLQDAYYPQLAQEYLESGIPAAMGEQLKGAEVELLTDAGSLTRAQKLAYVGRKTIAKYGCYGCHDIPGFEDAKPIGAALADWGRKEPEKLAFEHIHSYLHGHGHGHADHGGNHEEDVSHDEAHAAWDGVAPGSEELPEFYMDQLNMGNRIGFAFQKIREPRSYDYQKTEDKRYNEKLRMPLFPFSNDEREAVLTFVLGLVAQPPQPQYVYQPPDDRIAAIQQGRAVLEKYSCQSCHLINAEAWTIAAAPGEIASQAQPPDYPFVVPEYSRAELDESTLTNLQGYVTSTIHGMPLLDESGKPRVLEEDEGEYFEVESDMDYAPSDLAYGLAPWRPALINGDSYRVGLSPLELKGRSVVQQTPAWGGYLAKYLVPRITEREKLVNPNANGREAWGWAPPPLIGEGNKVQTEWLHGFLLEPHTIRPATVLRMPRFNMSSEEASQLVNFFAARDSADYPYQVQSRRGESGMAERNAAYAAKDDVAPPDGELEPRLRDAMKIVTSNNYCVKCHLVGDYEPQGSDRAKAPNLAIIFRRLQADYLRRWIANPKSILPYTSMPVNVPYDPAKPLLGTTVPQDLYHGTSVDQVDALVDLLMNYDLYTQQRSEIAPLVKTNPVAPDAAAGAGAEAP